MKIKLLTCLLLLPLSCAADCYYGYYVHFSSQPVKGINTSSIVAASVINNNNIVLKYWNTNTKYSNFLGSELGDSLNFQGNSGDVYISFTYNNTAQVYKANMDMTYCGGIYAQSFNFPSDFTLVPIQLK
jgi:hypothetical protein